MTNSNNITPADRVGTVKEYYFSKKLREIAQLNAQGADIISLGIGGPDLPPSQAVIDTLCEQARLDNTHGYQPYIGIPELREAYAQWYSHYYGVPLDPASEILPLIGSKEGILHITLAFVNPGDGVLVPNPGYPTYTSVSRLAQAEIFNYNLLEESNWQPDFDALEKMPLDKIKLMWVNYPNMPTGAPADMDVLRRIIDFGKKHNIVIVNDNPYSFILHKCRTSILSIEGAKDIAIELNSLSKSHNMAGWRMAALVSNPEFVGWALKVKSNLESGQFLPMMRAAVCALNDPDPQWHARLNAMYSERRAVAEQIMEAIGCRIDPSQTGLFLWGRIPEAAESAEAIADALLYDKHVFVTPGSIFGHNGSRYLRLSLCAPKETLQKALERLK